MCAMVMSEAIPCMPAMIMSEASTYVHATLMNIASPCLPIMACPPRELE